MIISGPILALSIACGSFLIICGSVMTVQHAKPDILTTAHYPNIEIYGKEATEAIPVAPGNSPTTVSAIIAAKKSGESFVCSLDDDKTNTFSCTVKQSEAPADKKSKCTATSGAADSYKIIVENGKLEAWKTKKDIYIFVADKENQAQDPYAKITAEMSIYIEETECLKDNQASK